MSRSVTATSLIASLPTAGVGSSMRGWLAGVADPDTQSYLALSNPASVDELVSGRWREESIEELRRAAEQAAADRVVLVGNCMGGLSAIYLAGGLAQRLGLVIEVLALNTPCPDSAGRIPTMSQFTDAQIAARLAEDGFPPEVLEDEDMLAEVAEGVRVDALVADWLAMAISAAEDLQSLHVLSTRGDTFIGPDRCAAWWRRVTGDFHLTVVAGGHTLNGSTGVLKRAIDEVIGSG